ncbi:MAG TPA: SGNH/GDSL hydrolase family protein [Thermoanaerobaculia bacterium]
MILFLIALIEIVSANDATVTYRERLPLVVALDPTTRTFHYKGCPDVRPGEERVSPAAAQLRGFKAHWCASLRKEEYAVRTERRVPRDSAHIAVLFIGNSLTYFNEMPRMTQQIGAPESRPLFVDAVTQSGASLEDLWIRTEALKRIWQEHWDYVILQERGGSAARDRGELFHKYLGMFAAEARKSGATPVLFMTWNAGSEDFFRSAARRANAGLLPVGLAWADLLARGDFSRLDWDGTHPNVAGSYLIASTVYATIYDKFPRDLPFDFRHLATANEFYDKALLEQALNDDQARMIQRAAWRAVQRVKNP